MKLNLLLDSIADKIEYLFCRWQDEKEFEEWEDYKVEMKKIVESVEGMELISVCGPDLDFGFTAYYEMQNIRVACIDAGGDTGTRITLTTF